MQLRQSGLSAGGSLPDLVLLDMMMSGMIRDQILEKMREDPVLAKVAAIFMTVRAQHAKIE